MTNKHHGTYQCFTYDYTGGKQQIVSDKIRLAINRSSKHK